MHRSFQNSKAVWQATRLLDLFVSLSEELVDYQGPSVWVFDFKIAQVEGKVEPSRSTRPPWAVSAATQEYLSLWPTNAL